MSNITVAVSDFAEKRHWRGPGAGHSWTRCTPSFVCDDVIENWDKRKPGRGETSLDRKVEVPLTVTSAPMYFCPNILIHPNLPLAAEVTQRQEGEKSFVSVFLDRNFSKTIQYIGSHSEFKGLEIPFEPAKFVSAICYSAEALEENDGKRSSDADWEIVCLICAPIENEPMHPLAMARNFLEEDGGTKSEYTAKEFADAIWYWSQRVKAK